MIFEIGHGRYVLLEEKVERTLARYVGHHERHSEAGGILIGSYRGPHVHVVGCPVPLADDVRGPTMFDRNERGHHLAARMAWEVRGGTETCVGEWHTHPEPHPEPSGIDRETWSALVRRSARPLVFLVVGWRSLWCGLGDAGGVRHVRAATDLARPAET